RPRDRRISMTVKLDAGRAEHDRWKAGGVEEVGAAHDVIAELDRLHDRDRLNGHSPDEPDTIVVDRQLRGDVRERSAKRRNEDMPDGELHGRVDGIELVDADRWVSGCGHLKAPFM